MSSPVTHIRLITLDDAEAITEHIAATPRPRPAGTRPAARTTTPWTGSAGASSGCSPLHASGESWPGVVLDGDTVIGQITVQEILQRAWRKASIGYWIGTPHQGQGHATRAVGLVIRL